jgi:uncharacterized membrane-anchored protein YitT (DUF2179 family)
MLKSRKILLNIRSYILITFGLFLHALGWTAFLIPAKIIGGGVAGISTILFFSTNIPVGYFVFAINAVLILGSMRILGAKFGIFTIYGISMISLFFIILQKYIHEPIVTDQFMSALIGGTLSGAGVGIAFANGGNTGGTDIIALIVTKYKNISPGRVILYLDIFIIASILFILKSTDKPLEKLVFGYVVMAVTSYTIDLVLEGAKQSYQIIVISTQNRIIADRIGTEVGRGITLLNGFGWYSKADVEVLMVIARKQDKPHIMRIIKETDIRAFISVAKVMGVYGQNFDQIKI